MSSIAVPDSFEQILDPRHTALLVWDMQVGIAPRAFNYASLRPEVDSLLAAARASEVLVAWSRHIPPALDHTAAPALRALMRQQRVKVPDQLRPGLQAGTPEAEFVPGIHPLPGEIVIEKSTPSFFIGTPLEIRLRARGITTLVLAGVATEHGIEFTARHASALGFFVVVVEDAVGSYTAAGHDLGLAYLRAAVDLLPGATVRGLWDSAGPS
jgi:nicotinamidase-related amidase